MCGTKCTVQANDLLRLGIAKFPWWAFLVILDDSNSGRFPKINLREFLGHPDNKIFGVNLMLRSVYTTPPLPYPPPYAHPFPQGVHLSLRFLLRQRMPPKLGML